RKSCVRDLCLVRGALLTGLKPQVRAQVFRRSPLTGICAALRRGSTLSLTGSIGALGHRAKLADTNRRTGSIVERRPRPARRAIRSSCPPGRYARNRKLAPRKFASPRAPP